MREELKSQGFEVITVAEDTKGAAACEPFIQAANPTHPSLLDPQHVVAELYNTKNVPAIFWINEEGRIVRANDPIYVLRRNRETGEATVNQAYLDGVRDWVEKGDKSLYLHDDNAIKWRRGQPDRADLQAMAHFRLGIYLYGKGDEQAAIIQFKKAHALKPNNWNYKRQAWNLGDAQRDYGTTFQEARNDPAAQPFYLPLDLPQPPRA
ncbi:MAG: redoxin domain-containing protein [Chloroflexi bacterium]|nr:redoxin domain-containing protein [Chloroflexota bacterium]